MSKRLILDIIWTVLAGGLSLGGIVLVARYQDAAIGTGTRVALIAAAVVTGSAGGALIERITRSRRRRRRRTPSRRTRRHNRKIAFILSGIVVATGIVSLPMADQTWLVASGAIVALSTIWVWYGLERLGLVRGMRPISRQRDPDGYRRPEDE